MNRTHIYAAGLALGILIFAGCGVGDKSVPQDGIVKFSIDGTAYSIPSLQFEIQPNNVGDMSAMHKEVISIKKGKNDFGFWINPTQAYKESFHGNAEAVAKVNWLQFSWFTETEDPLNYLKTVGKVTSQNSREPIWDITLPDAQMEYQTRVADVNNIGKQIDQTDMWIQFDEVTADRVKGHFGGSVFAHAPHNALETRTTQITDGQFDLPIAILYKYE